MEDLPTWVSLAIGFVSGVGVALVSAIAAHWLQHRQEKQRRVSEARFRIYMKLMELQGLYCYVAGSELRGDHVSRETANRIRSLAWDIADMLRAADEVEEVPRILRVLMSTEYQSATERDKDLNQLVSSLARTVNPRYSETAQAISKGNFEAFTSRPEALGQTPILMNSQKEDPE